MPLAKMLLPLLALFEPAMAQPAMAQPAGAQPGYMGINPAPINDSMRKEFRLADDVKSGLVLIQVFEGTAAARAGLRPGDVLTSFANKPVKSIEDLMGLIKNKRAGQKVAYVARRGSGTIAGVMVLGKRPAERRVVQTDGPAGKPDPVKEGDLERRMDRLQRDIEVARKRAAERKAHAEANKRPTSWKGWMEREERALERAERSGAKERILWHRGRLQLLREMRNAPKAGPEKRIRELEAQIQRVLERLERLEKSLK